MVNHHFFQLVTAKSHKTDFSGLNSSRKYLISLGSDPVLFLLFVLVTVPIISKIISKVYRGGQEKSTNVRLLFVLFLSLLFYFSSGCMEIFFYNRIYFFHFRIIKILIFPLFWNHFFNIWLQCIQTIFYNLCCISINIYRNDFLGMSQ